METTILDFCRNCGVLLPEGFGLEEEPLCENCGAGVKEKSARIQGVFSTDDAEALQNAGY